MSDINRTIAAERTQNGPKLSPSLEWAAAVSSKFELLFPEPTAAGSEEPKVICKRCGFPKGLGENKCPDGVSKSKVAPVASPYPSRDVGTCADYSNPHCKDSHGNCDMWTPLHPVASQQKNVLGKVAHDLWCRGGRLREELRDASIMNPEIFNAEALQQRLEEWQKAADAYFDCALRAAVALQAPPPESAPKRPGLIRFYAGKNEANGDSIMEPFYRGHETDARMDYLEGRVMSAAEIIEQYPPMVRNILGGKAVRNVSELEAAAKSWLEANHDRT